MVGAFVTDLLRCGGLEEERESITFKPSADRIEDLLGQVPLMYESSLITENWISSAYAHFLAACAGEIQTYPDDVKKFFNTHNLSLNSPETVFFHLVENRKNETYPFALLAACVSKTEDGRIVHHPLSAALEDFKSDKKQILDLLACLNQAADLCPLIDSWMVSGELFHPIGLTPPEAYEFLKAAGDLEEKAGIVCRIPNWWRKKASSIRAALSIGDSKETLLGMDSILSVKPVIQVDGMKLTKKEIELLLNSANSLVFIKGKWAEANPDKLKKLLEKIEDVPDHMSLLDAMRLQAGLDESDGGGEEDEIGVRNGKWLSALRAYQKDGYNWLNALSAMHFGALLVDDRYGKNAADTGLIEKAVANRIDAMLENANRPSRRILSDDPAELLGL